ncbi:MAG: hypothetical protein AAF828_06720 [Bacteroidota bacterium]
MHFTLIPILDRMAELYQMPRNRQRFTHYLSMLQEETKDDLVLPIAGYNPMGDDHILTKLRELMELDAEGLVQRIVFILPLDSPRVPAKNCCSPRP